MDRRVGGIGVLLVVITGVVVVSALSPTAIAGSATAVPVPGPPTVGDCLLARVDLAPVSMDGKMFFPRSDTGACTARHVGEITQVKSTFPVIPWGPSEDYPATTDPAVQTALTCPSGVEYLGLADTDPADGRVVGWYPTLNLETGLVSPNVRQQAAGQRWVACVLLNPSSSAPGPSGTFYAGRLQGGLTRGHLPDGFGQCSDGPSYPAVESCSFPHDRQDLGRTDLAAFGLSTDERSAACRRLAVEMTLMPDPTAGGRLRLVVDVERFDGDGVRLPATAPERAGESGFLTCTVRVVGTARLTGSLLGLGPRPVPLAG